MSLRVGVKKSCLSFFIAGLVLVSINISGAQVLSAIPGIGNVELGSIKVTPFAQVGYKNIGFNFNLPFTITPVDQFGNVFYGPPAFDLNLLDAGVWVGSVGLDARLPSGLFLTLRGDRSATKNISVRTGENFPWWDVPAPYTWGGSGLQWWDVDGMVGYAVSRDWSVLGGVRYDYLTVRFANPIDQTGMPVGGPTGTTTNLGQDIVVKTWIPYIGLQVNGPYYRASLIYSPLASPQVVAPQTITSSYYGLGVESSLMNYKFASTGSFLEGFFEYSTPISEPSQVQLWVRGTLMRIRGNGDWNFDDSTSPGLDSSLVDPQATTGTLNTYSLSGGISASLSF